MRGWERRKKGKNQNYSWYSAQGPGLIAQTPQAGIGDSASRVHRYHCTTVINYKSYFSVHGHLLSTIIHILDSGNTAKYSKCQISFDSMQVSFRFHSQRCSEILVSPSICTEIRICRFHRTKKVHLLHLLPPLFRC